MKKFISVALACMLLATTMVTASAAEPDQEMQIDNNLAYLDLNEATPSMQKKILKAREQIIYNTNWVADGYSGAVIDMDTGEVKEEIPHFSEVFPDWDVPVGEITENEVEALPKIGVSPDDFLFIYSKRVYLEQATQSHNADAFFTFQNDPYEIGTAIAIGATSLSSSETCNVGISDATTGESLLVQTRLSEGEAAVLYGVFNEILSCRASTYSNPGWATMEIDGGYRVEDAK